MTLWIVLTVMCSAAAVLMAIPLIRRFEARGFGNGRDAGVYRDQLKEVERDREAGLIGAAEAELARVEIERRLLASERQIVPPRPVSPAWRTAALVATTGFVVLGAVNLYAVNGRPDLPAATASSAIQKEVVETGTPAAPSDVDAMIAKLAAKLETDPSDTEGWRMLGWSYFNTQRYDELAAAYARAMALSPGNTGFVSAYAEAMVQAAGGIVAPKARELFESVLKADAKEERARFYLALAREQAGDLQASFDLWTSLLADAPADAGWLVDVRQHIQDLGKKTGRNVDDLLAGKPLSETNGTGSLNGGEQQAAVEAMVAKLAARLATNPNDRDGWAMLIRSLKVKGDVSGAEAALVKALRAFENDPSTRLQISALARSLGIGAGNGVGSPSAESGQDIASLPAGEQQAAILAMVETPCRPVGRLAPRCRWLGSPHPLAHGARSARSGAPGAAQAMAEFSSDADRQ